MILRPTPSGLLRRDFGALGLALLIPLALIGAFITHAKGSWTDAVGLTLFALAGVVAFARSATSYITVSGDQLRARGQFTTRVQCAVGDIVQLRLSDEGAVFGMTRSWTLTVELSSGQAKTLNGDMKRFGWLDVFRLADALSRPCDGPAMPYLAFVACGSRRQATEHGTIGPSGAWALIQRLGNEGATGKLVYNGSSGETWLYLVKGRNLRLEDDWPHELRPDAVAGASGPFVFEPSGLNDEEISLVVRVLDEKWLGASPGQGLSSASSLGSG